MFHAALGIGSRIVRRARTNYVIRVDEQEDHEESADNYLAVGVIGLTEHPKTIKSRLMRRGLQR